MFLGNLVITLREGLEASLVVGILVAYLIKVGRRDVLPKLWIGVGIALLVPLGAGAAMVWGPSRLSFQAQETLGGVLSLIAVALTTTMIFWMAHTARSMKRDLESGLDRALGKNSAGWGVVVIAALAVGREGLETALIIWAVVKSSIERATWITTLGIVTGLVAAIVIGYLIFRGAIRLNLGTFFTWTSAFLIFVAAGITAYGIGDLQEASVLPGGGLHAWDFSHLISQPDSPGYWLYTVLNAMFQVNAQPTWGQVFAWWAYIVPVGAAFLATLRRSSPRGASAAPVGDSTVAPPIRQSATASRT